jgi:hypothetical protein
MTMKSVKIALGVLLLATSFSGQALAAPNDGTGADTHERCSFVAEAGGYVCSIELASDSLVETGDGTVRKKRPGIVGPVLVPITVQICCQL